ncbi:MAG: LLM class flavin-dependent oxidoreductase [Dehalococcoidia bacterium]
MGRGIIFPGMDLGNLGDLAAHAEAANFDSYWVTESRGQDAFVRLAVIAQATHRIAIGSGIAYSFTRHPIAVAGAAADLDQLSGGRLIVGLGAGTKYMRQRWYGVDWAHPAPQMKDYVELMRAAWRAADPPGPLRFAGRSYTIDIDRIARPGMARPSIPVYAAALNPAMIRFAAEAFDGIALFPLALSKGYFDQVVVPNIEIGARRAGKSPRDVKIAAWLLTAVHRDAAEAFRQSQHALGFYFSTRSYGTVADLAGFTAEKERVLAIFNQDRTNPDRDAMADAISREMVEAMTLSGTPDEVRRKIGAFEERVDTVVIEAGGEGGRVTPDARERAHFSIDALSR